MQFDPRIPRTQSEQIIIWLKLTPHHFLKESDTHVFILHCDCNILQIEIYIFYDLFPDMSRCPPPDIMRLLHLFSIFHIRSVWCFNADDI